VGIGEGKDDSRREMKANDENSKAVLKAETDFKKLKQIFLIRKNGNDYTSECLEISFSPIRVAPACWYYNPLALLPTGYTRAR